MNTRLQLDDLDVIATLSHSENDMTEYHIQLFENNVQVASRYVVFLDINADNREELLRREAQRIRETTRACG